MMLLAEIKAVIAVRCQVDAAEVQIIGMNRNGFLVEVHGTRYECEIAAPTPLKTAHRERRGRRHE